jgi:nucleoside-diphosphate-sugar epimerase
MGPKIAITGAAGLVGQNLIPRLKARGYLDVVAVDKHAANTALLRKLHPDITIIEADLVADRTWHSAVADAEMVVVSHAQIGGLDRGIYMRNNVTATERLLEVARRDAYLVHISSSVVTSMADDFYIESKEAQEKLVRECGLPAIIFRPTLMFGWFDRKHLGWIARFMRRSPVFPVPGHGRYLRQPLYVGDFCDIVMACLTHRPSGQTHNISGLESINFVDLMRLVREACGSGARVVHVPYRLFRLLLIAYALLDRDPPFTAKQLDALATPDFFEVIDWPGLFGVTPTPLKRALADTYQHPVYSKIVLEF